jgi:hypothetical protein
MSSVFLFCWTGCETSVLRSPHRVLAVMPLLQVGPNIIVGPMTRSKLVELLGLLFC